MKKTLLLLVALAGLTLVSSTSASAAGFEAGRIIDDNIFTNKSSMSASSIQAFLNSKVPSCDTWGTQPSEFGGGTRRQWAESRGYSAPFTCLKDYSENGRSAAQIIYDISQQFSINPQVLIVLLQKEQSLVTDTWPLSIQYKTATGYGCPDTAPCDSQYFGLTNQLTWSGRMFRAILDNSPTWYTPYVLGNNFIRYSPDASCGGSTVNIQNRSTQALYNYTPYQPNAAALNAGWGTVPCGAYGNRNFYLYFTSWFGSTRNPSYFATAVRQSPYPKLNPGQGKTVYIDYKNNGSLNWYDDVSAPTVGVRPIHLAASKPINRTSAFSFGWPSAGRPNITFSKVFESDGVTLAAKQHITQPGQIARFEFKLTAPWTKPLGTYRESFQPVVEGDSHWNIGGVAWLDVTVESTHKAAYVTQCKYPTMIQNSTTECFIRYKNTGSKVWHDDISVPQGQRPVHLATSGPINRSSKFSASWDSTRRPGNTFSKVLEADNSTPAANQHEVKVGQIAEFRFQLTAKDSLAPGKYRERFRPILEGAPIWDMGGVAWIDITVQSNTRRASFEKQSSYPTTQAGIGKPVYFTFKNTSNTSWHDSSSAPKGVSPTRLAATKPINRFSMFSFRWASGGRPDVNFSKVYESDGVTLAANQHVVKPGQIAQFEFNVTPPWSLSPGKYREYFQLVTEGSTNWNVKNSLVWMDITITP